MSFNIIEEKLKNLEKNSDELVFLRKDTLNKARNLETEISKLDEENILLEKVSGLFKHLLDTLLDEKKKDIEHLVTYGLKTVFVDQDLKFHIDIETKYGGISTTFRTEQVGVAEGDVLESFGGGIVNLESFLLRVLTLFQTKLSPFLFLDESFSHLSEEYVENCSLLLNNLCKKLGLTICAITHKDLMPYYADKTYKAFSKDNKLFLSELKNDRQNIKT